MPTAAIKSLAKKAGKSVATAERYWKEGKASAKKEGAKNPYAYAMAITAKRLKVESVDLVRLGVPVAVVSDADLYGVGFDKQPLTEGIDPADTALAAVAIQQLYKTEVDEGSYMFERTADGTKVKESFSKAIEQFDTLTESTFGDQFYNMLKKILIGTPDYLIRVISMNAAPTNFPK